MSNRQLQLRVRRVIRRRKRQVIDASGAAEAQFERNLIGRFGRLRSVRRFTAGWIALVLLITGCTVMQTIALSGYYQTPQPVAGGIYNEGMVGTYSNANPIFATGAVDSAVSHLLFAGLFSYNNQNQLTPNLASGYSVDATGKHYTVTLKPHLTWQDGQPLTAQDVIFTFQLIQNPDVMSPLLASWQNIKITALNATTITFDLPNAYAAFPYSLTTGLLPQHILASVPAAQLRSNSFNTTTPVGAGPFAWQALQTSTVTDPDKAVSLIALKPFAGYVGGQPKLAGFILHAYGSQDEMLSGFKDHDVQAMAGLDAVPGWLKHDSSADVISFPSTAAAMCFFKTSSGVLADTVVRQALVQAANVPSIVSSLGYPAKLVREPFLQGQFSYNPKYVQASFDRAAAAASLDKAGWLQGSDGIRHKAGQALAFHLYGEDTADNRIISQRLVAEWRQIGANVTPVLQPLTDFQTTLEFHSYDALLNTISIGVDPDVYAYWDSSQADIRSPSQLNFSEYKSSVADEALEAGRTRLDPTLRTVKYQPFLQTWQADAPALGLFQPRFLYVTDGPVYGLTDHSLNVDADRYNSVANWEIHTVKVTNK